MSWYRPFGIYELIVIGLFLLAYLFFIVRVVRIGKKLKTPVYGVFGKIALRSIYFALLIVALMGPSFGSSKREVKSIGKDIMIAIDLSRSMNANDVPPTRLTKVKFELNKIVDEFSSDRIGLIIFSSEAFMQCPLTYDQAALNLFIETLHTGLVPNAGTDFGPALAMALDKLETKDESSVDTKAKIILLISDGEDFGEDTDNALEKIKERGIKLFTLGVGTAKGSKIETANGYMKDREGNDVITKLDSKSLKRLAAKTGGKYFEINDHVNDTERLINTINQVEGQLRDARVVDVSANKYTYFLLAAFILIVLDVLTSVKTIRI
ncbi:MAG: VWA domain-containing protein [Cyclobacteriaceae bacterium]|nr:VWA domain-containing protein [Cyclobacteriaceae bacterium]